MLLREGGKEGGSKECIYLLKNYFLNSIGVGFLPYISNENVGIIFSEDLEFSILPFSC